MWANCEQNDIESVCSCWSLPLSLCLTTRVGPQGTISGSMTNSFISSLVCHISWRWEFNTLFLFAKLQTGVMYCREHVDIGIPVERWNLNGRLPQVFLSQGSDLLQVLKHFFRKWLAEMESFCPIHYSWIFLSFLWTWRNSELENKYANRQWYGGKSMFLLI